jgi:hypothetical protein
MAGFQRERLPLDDLIWGTVATTGAVSWCHMDDEGFGTYTTLVTGEKYWVVFSRKPELGPETTTGDLGSISVTSSGDWSAHTFGDCFVAEAITLKPGIVL